MTRVPTPGEIKNYIHALDWTGQVELPDTTIMWLSEQIAKLWGKPRVHNPGVCEECEGYKQVIVHTKLGDVCDECLRKALREARMLGGGR